MGRSNLIRLSGLAAMLEGLLFIIAELLGLSRLGYSSLSQSFASGVFPVEALLTMVGAILGCWGWSASTPASRRLPAFSVWQAL